MIEIVIVEGGVVQDSTDNVIVIDRDNLEESDMCPHCGEYTNEGFCEICNIDWMSASFEEIRKVTDG